MACDHKTASSGMNKGENLTIRQPLKEDVGLFAEMWYELHKDGNNLFEACSQDGARRMAEIICAGQGVKADIILAGFFGETPAGWIMAKKKPQEVEAKGWYINGLEVRPSQRRKGVSGKLIRRVMELAGAAKTKVYTAIDKSNVASLAAFRSCGFSTSAVRGKLNENIEVLEAGCGDASPK